MNPPRILCLGEVLWDLFPDGERFGGAPANVACHAALLGVQVTMVGAVGNDQQGREAIGILKKFGIDTSLVRVDPKQPTGTVGIELNSIGKPRFTIHEDAAWDRLPWSPQIANTIKRADAVYFGTLGQRGALSRATTQLALDAAKDAGALRILDVNLRAPFFSPELIRESVEKADLLKLSDDELNLVAAACSIPLAKDPALTLRALAETFGLRAVVMTRGADGALFVSAGHTVDQPGIPANIVDTVGAGDSFTARLLVGLLRGEEAEPLLREACKLASSVCAQAGAIPTPSQLRNQPP